MDRRRFFLTTGGVAAFGLLHPGVRASLAAGGGNPMQDQPFVFNCDGNDVDYYAPPGEAQEWIRQWYRNAFSAGAGVFVADVALPDVVELKDCPSGEIIGARFPEEQRQSIRWYRTLAELSAQGTDVLHLACEEARRVGVVILGGARMSDAHHGRQWQAQSDSPLFPQVVMEHPEWCNTWEDGSRDATLNYALPQVQAHRLAILREMARNYDIDGLELNWMRWCRHFPSGHQREHLDDLTHFVHEVRLMLREVAKEKGRGPLILGHRVPVTLDECLDIGCDVGTWARRGYADYLSPMDFLFNDLGVHTEEFVRAVEGTGCLVYPSFGSTKYSFGRMYDDNNLYEGKDNHRALSMRSLSQFRATACNWYAWGARGGSCFNMYLWQPEQQSFYRDAIAVLSSPELAMAGPRHYVYLPVWKDHGGGVGPTGRSNCQSLHFTADSVGKRQAFTFRMADGRNGERLSGLLRFRIYGAEPGDEFAFDLNGAALAPEALNREHQPEGEVWDEQEGEGWLPRAGEPDVFKGSVPFTWPSNARFDVALKHCPPFRGDNELGVVLASMAPGEARELVMEALEVRVG